MMKKNLKRKKVKKLKLKKKKKKKTEEKKKKKVKEVTNEYEVQNKSKPIWMRKPESIT